MVHYRRKPWNGRRFRQGCPGAGHAVVATGRDTDIVEKAVGKSDNLRTENPVQTKHFDALWSTGNSSDWHDQKAQRNYPQLRNQEV